MKLNKLKKVLGTDVVQVTFTKKDGSNRVMKCTMDPARGFGAGLSSNSDKVESPKPAGLFRVLDIEAGGYRSFNFDQITDTQVL